MVTQKDKDRIIRLMMQDFPEASSSSIICMRHNYEDMEFDFIEDDERTKDGVPHHVSMSNLRKGFDILIELALFGEYKNYGFPAGIFGNDAEWDATDSEALVQCAIFGKIIYG
jgi:hypothetical protein